MEEIELKLRVPPEHVGKLKRSCLLRMLSHGRPVTRQLRSVYFDTPDGRLRECGGALRVRSIGRARIQTLKLPTAAANGLHVYQEFEHALDGDTPDLALLDPVALQAVFPTANGTAELAPVFDTEVARTVRMVRLDDSAIEVALDIGRLRAAGREQAICEAELELKQGTPARLFELALALHEEMPLALETRTKAQRGYDLLGNGREQFVKAAPARLSAGLTAGAAFLLLAHNCLDQIRGNQLGVLEAREPEAVHQMRIGIRRLRVLVGAYRTVLATPAEKFLREELRWLQQSLAEARDWHVFAEETLAPAAAALSEEPGLARLIAAARLREEQALEESCEALRSPRFTALLLRAELLLHSGAWAAAQPWEQGCPLDLPVPEFAAAVLAKRHRKLRRFGGRDAALDEPALHELRIQAKRMRYLGEFYRGLYPKKTRKAYLAHLAGLQDLLGTVQDAVVGRERLVALHAGETAAGDAAFARAGGLVTGWLEARRVESLQQLRGAWRSFRRAAPFWER